MRACRPRFSRATVPPLDCCGRGFQSRISGRCGDLATQDCRSPVLYPICGFGFLIVEIMCNKIFRAINCFFMWSTHCCPQARMPAAILVWLKNVHMEILGCCLFLLLFGQRRGDVRFLLKTTGRYHSEKATEVLIVVSGW